VKNAHFLFQPGIACTRCIDAAYCYKCRT